MFRCILASVLVQMLAGIRHGLYFRLYQVSPGIKKARQIGLFLGGDGGDSNPRPLTCEIYARLMEF